MHRASLRESVALGVGCRRRSRRMAKQAGSSFLQAFDAGWKTESSALRNRVL